MASPTSAYYRQGMIPLGQSPGQVAVSDADLMLYMTAKDELPLEVLDYRVPVSPRKYVQSEAISPAGGAMVGSPGGSPGSRVRCEGCPYCGHPHSPGHHDQGVSSKSPVQQVGPRLNLGSASGDDDENFYGDQERGLRNDDTSVSSVLHDDDLSHCGTHLDNEMDDTEKLMYFSPTYARSPARKLFFDPPPTIVPAVKPPKPAKPVYQEPVYDNSILLSPHYENDQFIHFIAPDDPEPFKEEPHELTEEEKLSEHISEDKPLDETFLMREIYYAEAEKNGVPREEIDRLFRGVLFERGLGVMGTHHHDVETIQATLRMSARKPILRMTNGNGASRFVYLNLHMKPTMTPEALDSFTDYTFPPNFGVAFLKTQHFVCVEAMNVREPLILLFDSREGADMFRQSMEVFQAAARDIRRMRAEKAREVLTEPIPMVHVLPSIRLKKHSNAPVRSAEEEASVEENEKLLREAAALFGGRQSLGYFWGKEQDVWTTYFDPAKTKYRTELLKVFIDPTRPRLLVCDKKGNYMLQGNMEIQTYTTSHKEVEKFAENHKLGGTMEKRVRSPYLAMFSMLENEHLRTIFSFETPTRQRDFVIMLTVLGHVQTQRVDKLLEVDVLKAKELVRFEI